jgi:hypothetical protein
MRRFVPIRLITLRVSTARFRGQRNVLPRNLVSKIWTPGAFHVHTVRATVSPFFGDVQTYRVSDRNGYVGPSPDLVAFGPNGLADMAVRITSIRAFMGDLTHEMSS